MGQSRKEEVDQTEGKRILVIDDEPRILRIVERFLTQGHQVYRTLTTSNPEEGIQIAQSKPVDLVLLDMKMPGLTGYQVYEKLQEQQGTASIPVIMFTSQANVEQTSKEFFYGLYGVVSKPFTREQLINEVEKVFQVVKKQEE